MKIKNRALSLTIFMAAMMLLLNYVHNLFLPVQIIDIHQDENFSSVLVKNFPVLDSGKIKWWRDNRLLLEEKHHIPVAGKYGTWTITFWDFGDGYKKMPQSDLRLSTENSDLLCFHDRKKQENCIEKKILFSVSQDRGGYIYLNLYNGMYRQDRKGSLIKYQE